MKTFLFDAGSPNVVW